jgi:hypothetical protein
VESSRITVVSAVSVVGSGRRMRRRLSDASGGGGGSSGVCEMEVDVEVVDRQQADTFGSAVQRGMTDGTVADAMRTSHGVPGLSSARLSQVPRLEVEILNTPLPPTPLVSSATSPSLYGGEGTGVDSSAAPTALSMSEMSSSSAASGGGGTRFVGGDTEERRGMSLEGIIGLIFACACVVSFAGHRYLPRLLGWGGHSNDEDDDAKSAGASKAKSKSSAAAATRPMTPRMTTKVVPSPSETAMRLPLEPTARSTTAVGTLSSVVPGGDSTAVDGFFSRRGAATAATTFSEPPSPMLTSPTLTSLTPPPQSPAQSPQSTTPQSGEPGYSAAAMAFARRQREEERRLQRLALNSSQPSSPPRRQQPSPSFEQRLALHNSQRAAGQQQRQQQRERGQPEHSRPRQQPQPGGTTSKGRGGVIEFFIE